MKAELTNRLMQFSKDLILTAQVLTLSTINRNTVEKCVESGTNAGAENIQASAASTKKSFMFRINMCKSCLQTASYRLELLVETSKDKKSELQNLFNEAKDLALIFNRISRKLKKGENDLGPAQSGKKVEENEKEEIDESDEK